MNNFSQQIAELSPAKRELLLRRLKLKNESLNLAPSPTAKSVGMTIEELQAEAILDIAICPEGIKFSVTREEPNAILLTGATGFIGAFLLDELLRHTKAQIYCLVRAEDINTGKQRLQKNLESYLLWKEHKSSRIIPVLGDLAKPLLGLSAEDFQTMANQIDLIYHCGALVKWTYPYNALKAANVLGTKEIIRLACHSKIKPLNFISTVGVFSSPSFGADVVTEQDALEKSSTLYGGYAQSKWVAEKLVVTAGSRGLPISIYRPNTGGDSKTGVFNKQDHLCLITKGCIQMGCAPTNLDIIVASAPIDYAVQAIVYLSKQSESFGKVFHIVNPYPIKWSEWINRVTSLGYPLKQLSYSEWKSELMNQVKADQKNELYALSPIFSDSMLEYAKLPTFDCQNTLAGLVGTPIVCPPLDLTLLNTYFSYFIKSSFLNAPEQKYVRSYGEKILLGST